MIGFDGLRRVVRGCCGPGGKAGKGRDGIAVGEIG